MATNLLTPPAPAGQELAACREERQALLAGLAAAEGRVHELAEHIQAVQSQVSWEAALPVQF